MSRYMYGVEYLREIDVNDQEHITRAGRQLQLPSGPKYLPDAFDCILAKVNFFPVLFFRVALINCI